MQKYFPRAWYLIIPFSMWVAFSCGIEKQANTQTKEFASSIDLNEKINNADVIEDEKPCVFNNDIHGLSTKWAKEVGYEDFIWDARERCLKIPIESDTILLSKGGCNHFTYCVELRLYKEKSKKEELEYWKKIAIDLAQKFQFPHFFQQLRTSDYTYTEYSPNVFGLKIADDDSTDNLIYEGVEVDLSREFKSVSLRQYLN